AAKRGYGMRMRATGPQATIRSVRLRRASLIVAVPIAHWVRSYKKVCAGVIIGVCISHCR
ncbi:hypothetical protein, partial [Dyella sp.]|uniref:hypothetical protein n=1 Tax=Dyella sp. TaxID=1869338 RepID=UPI002D770A1E